MIRFFGEGLGLEVLAEFTDHGGFDGVMLGWKGGAYHLEFTTEVGASAPRAPGEENLLVFYVPDETEYRALVSRMAAAGFPTVVSHNPYWDEHGVTYEDPDGYRLVLAHMDWR